MIRNLIKSATQWNKFDLELSLKIQIFQFNFETVNWVELTDDFTLIITI